tara:strand:- start:25977 stop:26981 length:1005 start_codon:yes stop_codon:yes gene_type:complete
MERIQKKIKGILIGCGKIGGFYDTPDSTAASKEIYSYAAAIDRNNTLELVACVDIDIEKASSLAQRFKIAEHESSFDKLITREDPSFVIVATPDDTHFAIVSQLLSLANPARLIIVEKPICFKWNEFQHLKAVAKEKKVEVIVNHSRRFDQRFYQLKKEIQQNTFGDLFRVDFYTYGSWKKNGIHLMDTLVYLMDKKIKGLTTEISPSKVDLAGVQWTDVKIIFGNKFVVNIHENPEEHYQLFEMDFKFTKGRIHFQDFENRLTIEKKQINYLNENIIKPLNFSLKEKKKSNMESLIEVVENFFKNNKSLNEYSLTNIDMTMKTYLKLFPYYEN